METKSKFLSELQENYPTFEFTYNSDNYGYETLENLNKFNYYITIAVYDEDRNKYGILLTSKVLPGAPQQSNFNATREFIISSLNNLMILGF